MVDSENELSQILYPDSGADTGAEKLDVADPLPLAAELGAYTGTGRVLDLYLYIKIQFQSYPFDIYIYL